MAIHGNRKNKQTVLKSSTKGRFGDLHCLFWWRVCNTITSNPKLTGDIRWPLNVQFCTCTAQRHKGSQTCHSSDYSDLPMTDPCMVGIYANMTGGILMGSMAHHIYIYSIHGSVMGKSMSWHPPVPCHQGADGTGGCKLFASAKVGESGQNGCDHQPLGKTTRKKTTTMDTLWWTNIAMENGYL